MSYSYREDVLYSTVDETYPQSRILSRMMVGKPAWSCCYPWLIVCGKDSWVDFIPLYIAEQLLRERRLRSKLIVPLPELQYIGKLKNDTKMSPLLSICVPTYNRADRLRVMLQAVLPQVAAHADKVELWISDNASPDHTPRVVEEARSFGQFQYSRNQTNVGLVSNLIRLTTELAQGEFVWVLGDDDLLRPSALSRVLKRLEANRELDLMCLNFRYASYEKHWPQTALGGYSGIFEGVGNPDMSDHPLEHWHEMLHAYNSMCSQVYVHVVRRTVWQDYWRARPRQPDFSDSRWSFPHSYMIAETVMNHPSYYVGEPILTIFNGAQTWWGIRHRVVFNFAGVLRAYEQNGLPKDQVRECEQMVFRECQPLLVEILRGTAGPEAPSIISYLRANWRFAEAWHALARASDAAGSPWLLNRLFSAISRIRGKLSLVLTN